MVDLLNITDDLQYWFDCMHHFEIANLNSTLQTLTRHYILNSLCKL